MLRMRNKGVAIRPARKEETTEGGIIIPTTVVAGREQGSLNEGEVVYVASDVTDVKPGDVVVYVEGTYWKNSKRTNKDEFVVDGEDLILVKKHEIKAIVEG